MAAMGAAGCLLLIVVMATQGLSRAGVWAAPLAALAGIVAAVATVWALRPQQPQAVLPPKMEVPDWVVERPAELSKVVAALVGGRARTVGIATGVHGGGGW